MHRHHCNGRTYHDGVRWSRMRHGVSTSTSMQPWRRRCPLSRPTVAAPTRSSRLRHAELTNPTIFDVTGCPRADCGNLFDRAWRGSDDDDPAICDRNVWRRLPKPERRSRDYGKKLRKLLVQMTGFFCLKRRQANLGRERVENVLAASACRSSVYSRSYRIVFVHVS